ncbi:hypothetical protein ACJWDR_29040 [Streptomyces tauricus]|uniref:hypothetical protein n=1 Tax=Streptomyces tauricus TaxID=68274 RepID=UPI00387EEAB9
MNQPDPTETDAVREARLRETYGGNWPVQNSVHFLIRRLDEARQGASALTNKLRRARDLGRRLTAHAAGFSDVLDASDRGPWERTVAADIAALRELLDAPAPAVPSAPTSRAADARVRALHERYRFAGDDSTDYCSHCNQISGGWIPWPCATIAALDAAVPAAEEQPENETPDLPARLEAALTERFTELGNPFSRMSRREKGPDGWPAEHPVGPHHVAEVLRELQAAPPAVVPQPEEVTAPEAVCVCSHARREHITVSGRLLCDACDPDSTDNLVCRGFDAL